jgi:hypothetical protein
VFNSLLALRHSSPSQASSFRFIVQPGDGLESSYDRPMSQASLIRQDANMKESPAMKNETKVIKNPLTIVGVFAGLVEICGSVVFHNLGVAQQNLFIWFLMGFPTLLLLLFFTTLNFNNRVLYAPSDYKDEDNFIKTISPLKLSDEQKKLQEELTELIKIKPRPVWDSPKELPSNLAPGDLMFAKLRAQRTEKLLTAESLAIGKLEREFGDKFQRGASFGGMGNSKIIFDGYVPIDNEINAVEIKYVDSTHGLKSRINNVVNRAKEARLAVPERSRSTFKLMIVLILDNGIPWIKALFRSN